MKSHWKEVYRSANKRVLRRRREATPTKMEPKPSGPSASSGADSAMNFYLAVGLILLGLWAGGFTGIALVGIGALLLYCNE